MPERERARSVLKGRFQIGPMKEGFNGLTSRTDRETGTIPGTQNIIALSLFRRNNFNITTLFQWFCPINITISLISEQPAKRNGRAISVHLFCGKQIWAGWGRNLRGLEEGKPTWSEHDKDVEFYAVIPLLTGGVVAFITISGSHLCACTVRACLKSPCACLGGVFSALTALKILAIRQDACGFLPCRAKNPLANPYTSRY